MVTASDFGPWPLALPEFILALVALFLPFAGRRGTDTAAKTALAALFVAFIAILWMIYPAGFFTYFGNLHNDPVLLGSFEVTPFALFFKLLFVGLALLVVALSPDTLGGRRVGGEYYSLLLLSTIGMMVVASARDLMTIFIGLETAALSSYCLVGLRRIRGDAVEGATKFFIIGALSAALTLFGISMVYALAGTVNIIDATVAFQQAGPGIRIPLLVAATFLIAGFGFKITSVPFHMWAPDVYQGAPDPVTALLSGASKKMGFAAFFKVFLVGLIAYKADWGIIVGLLAVLTMTVGNLAALKQTSFKRLLAWSSVGQAGYIMIALAVATPLALTGGLFHALTHGIMKVGAFLIVGALAVRGIGDNLDSYRGLGKRSPLLAGTLTVIMLSLAGIPPLAGFWSKFILFGGAVEAGVAQDNNWFIFLAVAGIANSAISVIYYAKAIRAFYLDETAPTQPPARISLPVGVHTVVLLVLLFIVIIGFYPHPWIEFSRTAASSLIHP